MFKERHKPPEVVRVLKENFLILEKGEKKNIDKVLEEISKYLSVMKGMLYGTAEQEPQTEQVASLAQEIYQSNLLVLVINQLHRVPFEDKKEITHIFNNVLRRQIGKIYPTVDYLLQHKDILSRLLHGYEDPEIALHCGAMLRECCRHEELTKEVLESPDFYNFFYYVELSTFDVASDAFSTFKEFLTRHKAISAAFLERNYDTFFEHYQKLLLSENYVTRRQSLKLLGELLLDRYNFSVMARYISNPDNLKLMMNLFREKSSHIQFEAFHVFKVFVANPNKPKAISDILVRNREKLIDFLASFNADRTDDEQFCDEKAYLIKQIKELKDTADTTRSGNGSSTTSAAAVAASSSTSAAAAGSATTAGSTSAATGTGSTSAATGTGSTSAATAAGSTSAATGAGSTSAATAAGSTSAAMAAGSTSAATAAGSTSAATAAGSTSAVAGSTSVAPSQESATGDRQQSG